MRYHLDGKSVKMKLETQPKWRQKQWDRVYAVD